MRIRKHGLLRSPTVGDENFRSLPPVPACGVTGWRMVAVPAAAGGDLVHPGGGVPSAVAGAFGPLEAAHKTGRPGSCGG